VILRPPRPLSADHDLSRFDCGQPLLDDWLKERAVKNQTTGASRTYVVCQGDRVVAFYSLATGSVDHGSAPGRVRRNMPDPIPVMIIARLAVDSGWQGQGVAKGMLKDAIVRTLEAAEIAGIRALLVHALDEAAAGFYRSNDFLTTPNDPLILVLPLADARRALP
jgi:GNAT superfamily N-acetyltransferase